MEFVLKHYKKNCCIQLKPKAKISTVPERCVHFSIAWFRGKELSKDAKRAITAELYKKLEECLEKNGGKLTFTIVAARENCSYGHMNDDFEQLVTECRAAHPELCTEKNLPLESHPDVPQDRTIMFHIAHSRSTDDHFNALLKKPGEKLDMTVECVEVNK